MMHPEQVRDLIAAGLPGAEVEVKGDGQHFEALIVSAEFAGENRVQRQQRINALLRAHFDSGELHALSMQTLTPEERSASRG
ncbi:BolA family protein [Rhodocyclus tenuis]|uniref:Acid stress-induced BolA-like protein IbaG/YrbA n=1 Tax=Rhodocyclus tenuis TaxID=1066 RepID=A0A840G686_RHOTE|nr:BolA/IbaG family iron-sulfur metabolism protein [Rhodocyclus tenuis]MBB4246901.1 acid stress-induced BolA-like protein IbaG/YrbA [Rhodocyclus tenuis]